MIQGRAILKYYNSWCIAYVDPAFGEYYFALAPKWWNLQRPKARAHITIVRKGIETPSYNNWGFRDGKDVLFEYDPIIWKDSLYAWIDVYSDEIGNLREVLGLPRFRKGFDRYHLTIGNFKNSIAVRAKDQYD